MDYRHRDYYLVSIDYSSYDMRMQYYKIAAPSLKIHPPYNHFKNGRDWDMYNDVAKGYYWQMMMSCKKEDSEALEYELRKAERNDNSNRHWTFGGIYGSHFLKLSKELLGQ
jgi:hypothetical protein